jgi:thiol-disulfide isomerase/thioredoxin
MYKVHLILLVLIFSYTSVFSQSVKLAFEKNGFIFTNENLKIDSINVVRYSDSISSFSLAIFDKNNDGRITLDSKDLIYIDFYETQFFTRTSSFSNCPVKEHLIFESSAQKFKINTIDSLGKFIEFTKCEAIEGADLKQFDYLPDLTIKMKNGTNTSLNSFLKKNGYLLIEIWSVFCGPCLKSFPLLNEYQAKYKDDLAILTLLDRGNQEDLDRISAKYNNVFSEGFSSEEINVEFNIVGHPNYFLFDSKGKLVGKSAKSIDILNRFESFLIIK